MKIFFCISFFLFSFTLKSQTVFPLDSSFWHYSVTDPNFSIYTSDYYTIGDTVINSKQYILVRNTNNLYYIYRLDTNEVVYTRFLNTGGCIDTNEIVSYSFILHLHDSIYIKNCKMDSVLCILSTKDSVLTNHGYKNRFIFDLINDIWPTCFTSPQMTWIEGIGSTNDLFYNLNFPLTICERSYDFLSIDSFGYNIHLIPLDIRAIKFDSKLFELSNYTIKSKLEIESIYIFDLTGKCICFREGLNVYEFNLYNLMNTNKGIYFLKIGTSNGFNFNRIIYK